METAGGLLDHHVLVQPFWDSDQVWTRLQKEAKKKGKKKKERGSLPLKLASQDSWDTHEPMG
jgi:hypothetical protein